MTSLHRYLSVIVLALAIAALAAPIAQAGSAHPDLAGQTEAKGYAALSQAILNTQHAVQKPGSQRCRSRSPRRPRPRDTQRCRRRS